MSHRIREELISLGSDGGTVEVDGPSSGNDPTIKEHRVKKAPVLPPCRPHTKEVRKVGFSSSLPDTAITKAFGSVRPAAIRAFEETATELEANQAGEAFEPAINTVAPARPPKPSSLKH